MVNKKRSITANVFFNLLYQSLTILMPLITTPYLSRVIGSEGLGINGYTLSIVTYFVLFGSLLSQQVKGNVSFEKLVQLPFE